MVTGTVERATAIHWETRLFSSPAAPATSTGPVGPVGVDDLVDEARATYERYHVPASGNIFWGSALANIHPGKDDNYVDYHNDDRKPLLFISGEHDNLMPPKIQRSNAKHYKAPNTITEVIEYPGRSHLMPAQQGWEEVADRALAWALNHSR